MTDILLLLILVALLALLPTGRRQSGGYQPRSDGKPLGTPPSIGSGGKRPPTGGSGVQRVD